MPSAPAVASSPSTPRGARVFISYSHKDDDLRASLRSHLAALEHEGLVRTWDDREILAGDAWADEIDTRLNQADVILLLVSADFINSPYCYGKELARALERNRDPADRATVVPIILRACVWQIDVLKGLQALPTDGRPLSAWTTPDDYYTAVTSALRRRLLRMVDADTRWIDRVWGRLRDPRWWQQPKVWVGALALLASSAAAGTWWWRAADEADRQVQGALADLRSSRAADAVARLQPVCRAWVSGQACFVLQKAELGAQLEQLDPSHLERFATRVRELQANRPVDADLLLIDAQLRLRGTDKTLYPSARADIGRAIALAGGSLPEAHFVLANLEMMQGRHAEALPHLNQALDPATNRVAPEHYLNARGYARARTGDLRGAIEDYEQSIERGSILSRLELAELLWTVSEYDRAADQLQHALQAMGDPGRALAGRNALPWVFEPEPSNVILRQPVEKHCFARWMHRAGLRLAGRAEPAATPTWADCGPEATRVASAVASVLVRASGAGMSDAGRARVIEFVREHRLR